jgi:hypothetical protein
MATFYSVFSRLSREHDRWKHSLLESLHEKDRKILEIQQQKENFIAEVQVLFKKKTLKRFYDGSIKL